VLSAALGLVYGCIASAPEGIHRQSDAAGGGSFGGPLVSSSTGSPGGPDDSDPHAVIGVVPPHGPFAGGNQAVVHGRGFKSDLRVWFGDTEVDQVTPIDPTRAQVKVPAGAPGAVDVHAQNGEDESTRRSLVAAYAYDALYAVPDTGPVAGGTVIDIYGAEIGGMASNWDMTTSASIDGKSCTTLDVVTPSQLRCTVPQGTPGSKNISVTHAASVVTAFDGYTYQDSADGYKGGLSGALLAGTLRVFAYDDFSGDALPGAHVIVGDDVVKGPYAQTGSTGGVVISDASLTGPVTVTIAARCHSPITFVDVPVDTITAYLEPVLSPACASDGDPPPVGGNPTLAGYVAGELVWKGVQEFQKGKWTNVPSAIGPYEKRIAYVAFAQRRATKAFSIPSSVYTVDEDSDGDVGYKFQVPSYPGNQTLYALAGILNTQTQYFSAYAFGVVQGVAVFPAKITSSVIIDMNTGLDQALTLQASPPPPASKGPDRLAASLAVEIAQGRYAILPDMQKAPLLPLAGDVKFIGLPPLDGALTGSRYHLNVAAVTGPGGTAPMSVVAAATTHTTSQPVVLNDFVALPTLATPVTGGAWNGRDLASGFSGGALPAELTVYDVVAGGGLMHWTIAVPSPEPTLKLPDLSGFELAGLPKGAITIKIYAARIDGFDYAKLRYRNLRPAGMTAYALDVFAAYY
jgi:hypothetical protein